jgi:DNA repair metallo-beta-lactamase
MAGCLTTDSSSRIHSCEPGTPCHTELLKSKRVVWITPIITRSREGLAVPELGAGGSGGDLYQTPELDLFNVGSTGEVEDHCKQLTKETDHLANFVSKIDFALTSRKLKISLNGLDLDAQKEIPLQEFLKRLLALDQVKPAPHNDYASHITHTEGSLGDDTLHFPFSRHSSYNELCDMVTRFRPREIYPCTVEEKKWTEDVSMEALFGHLCSGNAFHHDQKMRMMLHERLENGGSSKKRQRMSNTEDSQASRVTENASQEYNTADEVHAQEQLPTMHFPSAKRIQITHDEDDEADEDLTPDVMAIKAVYDAHMARATGGPSVVSNLDEDGAECEHISPPTSTQVLNSQISISESVFESQSQGYVDTGLQPDGTHDEKGRSPSQSNIQALSSKQADQRSRRNTRAEAYRAARLTLQTSDSGTWDDLGIRSIGNKGHCETEEEL